MNIFLLLPLLCGLGLGWLVNYLADVLPDTVTLTRPKCPNPACAQTPSWAAYLQLRNCAGCGRRRSPRTFITLGLLPAASLFLWLSPPAKLGYVLGTVVFAYLLTVAIIDLEHRLVLRPLSIAGLLLGASAGVLQHGWKSTLIGGLVGLGVMSLFYLFGMLFTRLRARRLGQDPAEAEEAFGSGDISLGTILGLLLGWPLIWFGLLLGLLASGAISLIVILVLVIVRRYKEQAFMVFIPLGPGFILIAVLILYLPNLIGALVPK
ncbi:MAG: prepilin peptidase [Anaerolineales bacterium]|nr:prepilin peptidase [Anaerolineales bacterium]